MSTKEIMFSLLSFVLTDKEVDGQIINSIDEGSLSELYELSNKHDLSHMIFEAFSRLSLGFEGEIAKKLEKKWFISVYRYEQIRYEIERIKETLSAAEIPFILLKGAKIREYYPQPFLRTSCDIDVLVKESDLRKATLILETNLFYETKGGINYHDVSLYSRSGVHIELHHSIKENIEKMDKVLDLVWENSCPVSDGSYRYEQSDEYLYFHSIAHMAYHFLSGGCGVRSVLDVYLLNKRGNDRKKVDELLSSAGLLRFEEGVLKLANAWLEGDAHTDTTEAMEEYILFGGIYGNFGSRMKIKQAQKGSRAGYILSRIFLPYKSLREQYKVLYRHKWLAPFCQVCRWFRFIFSDRIKRGRMELKESAAVTREERTKTERLLSSLELM